MVSASSECYAMVSSTRTLDGSTYTAYGIARNDPGGTPMQVEDISCNELLVARLVEVFNLCELPVDRLKQTIVDLLP